MVEANVPNPRPVEARSPATDISGAVREIHKNRLSQSYVAYRPAFNLPASKKEIYGILLTFTGTLVHWVRVGSSGDKW